MRRFFVFFCSRRLEIFLGRALNWLSWVRNFIGPLFLTDKEFAAKNPSFFNGDGLGVYSALQEAALVDSECAITENMC